MASAPACESMVPHAKSPTHYEILGLSPGATIEEIEAAGRRALFKWHPDRNALDRSGAERTFIAVQEALEVLRPQASRAAYDRQLGRLLPPTEERARGVRFEQMTAEAGRALEDQRRQAGHRSRSRDLRRDMESLAALARGRNYVSRRRFYGWAGLVLVAAAFHLVTVTTVFEGIPVMISAAILGGAGLQFLRVARDAIGQRLRRASYREMAEKLACERRSLRAPFGPISRR